MNNTTLLNLIFFGDFGIFTAVPRYLFLILFPVMIFLGILSSIFSRLPFLQSAHPWVNQFFYILIGFGCTTAALSSLDSIGDMNMRKRIVWILVLLIPCSSQMAITATFASMVALRVFTVYLLFCLCFMLLIYFLLCKLYPLTPLLTRPASSKEAFHLFAIIKTAFASILSTVLPFCIGSAIVSIFMYLGFSDMVCRIFAPFSEGFLHLPPEAMNLFILNILKRDFGSASLLAFAGDGSFSAVQLVVMMTMMTFAVPCFNSTILLIKQQKLPEAVMIWLGSLCISVLIGKTVSTVLLLVFS